MIDVALHDVYMDFGFKKILQGMSFELQAGEKAALVGGNGTGKTTILRLIADDETTCDKGLVTIRKAAAVGFLEQVSTLENEALTVADYIKSAQQPIFDLENRLRELEARMAQPNGTTDKLLSEYGRLQNEFITLDGYETDERYNRICEAFKLDEAYQKKICNTLSGGQKTVVKLAQLLLQAPDILLLDEPTNHLDIQALQWLENIIREYKGTVLLVSHDRYFLDKTVKKTLLLENGKVEAYAGNYSYCLQEQERRMMVEFEQYKNQQKMIEAMKASIKRYREWGERAKGPTPYFRKAKELEKRLERMEYIDKPKLEKDKLPLDFTMKNRSGKRVLMVDALDFSYGENVIFEKADMEIVFKDKVCLLGSNGTGKTTLIKIILDNVCDSVSLAESARIGYIEQEVTFPNEKLTILEAFREDAVVNEQDARRLLSKFYIMGDEVKKRLQSLSGGERVILKLAMLMQKNINFLILDEPTNHLDIYTKEVLEESLATYQGTLLFISHDRYFINKIATKIIAIENKKLMAYDGNYDTYHRKR